MIGPLRGRGKFVLAALLAVAVVFIIMSPYAGGLAGLRGAAHQALNAGSELGLKAGEACCLALPWFRVVFVL